MCTCRKKKSFYSEQLYLGFDLITIFSENKLAWYKTKVNRMNMYTAYAIQQHKAKRFL